MGHADIATEHLLLGLLGEPEGVAAEALRAAGVEEEEVRRATSRRNRKRKAACTEATARSVSASVTRITGQTPPMSHSAIISAASAFMRRSRCITSVSPGAACTSRDVFSISPARCDSGSHASSRIRRAASARINSNR